MSLQLKCAVCKQPTTLFNYGVISCNACKMFYRRALTSPNFPTECAYSGGNCSNCRYCRYQKCVTAGMKWNSPTKKMPDLSEILNQLKYLDSHRSQTVMNLTTNDNFGLNDIISSRAIVKYTEKPEEFNPGFYEWAMMYQTTSIDCHFEFAKDLDDSDLKIFIKSAYLPYLMFCNAMRCFIARQEYSDFPGGVDVYPDEIKRMFSGSPEVLNQNKTFLVARLINLKITESEFLLLSAVFICNPATSNLSQSAQTFIANHQNIYTSALLQYCMNTYQKCGPSRFADLISLFHPINEAYQKFGKVLILFKMHHPDVELKKIFMDLIDLVMIRMNL